MYFSGHFNDYAGVVTMQIQYGTHHPMEEVNGYTGSHWTMPSSEYLPPLSPWQPPWSGIVKSLFQSWRSKCTKRTLYSAHRRDKWRRKFKHHDLSRRSQQSFQLSNANTGQKSLMLLITKDAH